MARGRNIGKQLSSKPVTISADDSQKTFDISLIEKIRTEDVTSFEYLFKTYYADLVRFALRFVKSQPDAEEIVQDIFVKIWENKRSWHVHSTIRAYLFGAVRNRALNYLRSSNSKVRLEDVKHSLGIHFTITPADTLHAKDFEAACHEAIAALPSRSKEIFLLHREEGLSYLEIASALNISVNTVETHMTRALKKLRKLLSEHQS